MNDEKLPRKVLRSKSTDYISKAEYVCGTCSNLKNAVKHGEILCSRRSLTHPRATKCNKWKGE